jgi:hypothetical protein
MKLNAHDVERITDALKNVGIRNQALLEEMVDHYCSEVESHIALGIQNTRAVAYVTKQIDPVVMQKLQRQSTIQNIKNKAPMAIIIICIAILFTFPFLSDNKTITPQKGNEQFVIAELHLEDPPYLWPLQLKPEKITSHFGPRMNPITKLIQQHKGIDIKAKTGTIVIAPADASVLDVGYNEKDGHFIILQHDDIYQTKYCHLSKAHVEIGNKVKAGITIGEVGNSGVSTKSHLHYEVIKSGKHVDPIEYLKT